MADTRLYAKRDHAAQGEHYTRHVEAMTREGLHSKSDIAGELAARDIEIARLSARAEQAELELSICRDAIEVCWDVANELPSDDDGDAAVRRCTLRRLAEAVGKAAPRLLLERPEGQKLYGLRYREMRDRAEQAEAERDAAKEREQFYLGMCREAQDLCSKRTDQLALHRECISELVACHEEDSCPAVAWGRALLEGRDFP